MMSTTLSVHISNKKIKIKILLFFILAMISDLNVTKNNTTLKANTPQKGGITWQPPGPSASHVTRTLWSIFSVEMNCLLREKFFVYISTRFASNAVRRFFVYRPEGVFVIRLCFFHAFIYQWFWAVDPYTKFNSASVVNPGVKSMGINIQCVFRDDLGLKIK